VPPAEAGWTPIAYAGFRVAVEGRSFSDSDGRSVAVVRFRADRTWFDLHIGSQDPPHGRLPEDAGPAVSSGEAPLLLGGFNGGFQVSTGSGGVTVEGIALAPLQNGKASFVIDANGSAHLGVWGSAVPVDGELVTSVRQNLRPLVEDSQPAPGADDPSQWGATLGGGWVVARSAVGQDASGNVIYAGSMAALPADLADALVASGATVGMELDINPEWVQAVAADAPGGALVARVPGQDRPAGQILSGWTRDFVAVLAAIPIEPAHLRSG